VSSTSENSLLNFWAILIIWAVAGHDQDVKVLTAPWQWMPTSWLGLPNGWQHPDPNTSRPDPDASRLIGMPSSWPDPDPNASVLTGPDRDLTRMPAGLMASRSGCRAADRAVRPDMVIQIFPTHTLRSLVNPQPLQQTWSTWTASQRILQLCRHVQQIKSWQISQTLTIWSQNHTGQRHFPTLQPYLLLVPGLQELMALCKFIDENLATRFIHPLCSSHEALVLFIHKKDSLPWLCINFQGINWISKKKLISTPTHLWHPRCTTKGMSLHQDWPPTCIPSCPGRSQRWMENHIQNPISLLRVVYNAWRAYQCTCSFPVIYEWHLCRHDWCYSHHLFGWHPHLLWQCIWAQSPCSGSTTKTPC